MTRDVAYREKRQPDPYLDRRSGEDRREMYLIDYFSTGGVERRSTRERRGIDDRRTGCVRVSKWSSVCPSYREHGDREMSR